MSPLQSYTNYGLWVINHAVLLIVVSSSTKTGVVGKEKALCVESKDYYLKSIRFPSNFAVNLKFL